eukprot:7021346-Prymnesium_polylepis.2
MAWFHENLRIVGIVPLVGEPPNPPGGRLAHHVGQRHPRAGYRPSIKKALWRTVRHPPGFESLAVVPIRGSE